MTPPPTTTTRACLGRFGSAIVRAAYTTSTSFAAPLGTPFTPRFPVDTGPGGRRDACSLSEHTMRRNQCIGFGAALFLGVLCAASTGCSGKIVLVEDQADAGSGIHPTPK